MSWPTVKLKVLPVVALVLVPVNFSKLVTTGNIYTVSWYQMHVRIVRYIVHVRIVPRASSNFLRPRPKARVSNTSSSTTSSSPYYIYLYEHNVEKLILGHDLFLQELVHIHVGTSTVLELYLVQVQILVR